MFIVKISKELSEKAKQIVKKYPNIKYIKKEAYDSYGLEERYYSNNKEELDNFLLEVKGV